VLTFNFTVIQAAFHTNDTAKFYKIKGDVEAVVSGRGITQPSLLLGSSYRPNYTTASMPSWNHTTQSSHLSRSVPVSIPPAATPTSLAFKPSPFYDVRSLLGKVHECES
jgi:hypothetical protein